MQKLLENMVTDTWNPREFRVFFGGLWRVVKPDSEGLWAVCFKTKQVEKNVVILSPIWCYYDIEIKGWL